MQKRAWAHWLRRLLIGIVVLAALAACALWLTLRASLAQLDGTRRAPGLHADVTVVRDANGVPTISGSDRLDVAYATGFVHGQERFFQIDLLRRVAAGELAELFGPKALDADKAHRLHRFRARAAQVLAAMPAGDRALLERYVAGVNDGVDALAARPFEYLLTGTRPRPWAAADSLLVMWAMYFDLQGNLEPRELARGWLRDHTDAAQRAFLLPELTEWDAALDAAEVAPRWAPVPASAPLWWGRPRSELSRLAQTDLGADFVDAVGSNNWALAGSRSTTGAAIVSNDMHLGLQLPNIWYRMVLRFPDAQGAQRRLVGVTLPGAPPAIIAGSNGNVAWGFTNSYGDYLDLVTLGRDRDHPGQLYTPGGWERPAVHLERILVKGGASVDLAVRETSLGPVRDVGGKLYALHWIAHRPDALNLNLRQLEHAATLDEALALAARAGIPAQNFVAGDREGNIGWTIAGLLPRRARQDGSATFPLAPDGAQELTWQGTLAPDEYPRVVNPASGQLSTANSRQLIGAGAQLIGDGGFDLGARNRQVRDGLLALGAKADVDQAYRVSLDDRALFIAPWRERALRVLDQGALAGHPMRAECLRQLQSSWTGRASVDSVAYRMARGYMWALYELMFDGANGEMHELDQKANMAGASSRWPVVLARLLEEQPSAWLPPGYPDWRAVELAAIDRVIVDMTSDGRTLSSASWGLRNTATIAHPIGAASPMLLRWLAVPPDQLPGDANMPRVAGPRFGQSERMTVSPGREEQGIFNMPGGQSGHPLSPFFLRGHEDWVQGRPTALLPGPARHTLTLAK